MMNINLLNELTQNIKTCLETKVGSNQIIGLTRSKAELYLAEILTQYLNNNNINSHEYIREFKPFYNLMKGSIDLAIFENNNLCKQQFPDLSVEFKHFSNAQNPFTNKIDFLYDINKRKKDLNLDIVSVFFYTCVDNVNLDKSDNFGQLDYENITLLNYRSKNINNVCKQSVQNISNKNKDKFFEMFSEQVETNPNLKSEILVSRKINTCFYCKEGRLDFSTTIYCAIYYNLGN